MGKRALWKGLPKVRTNPSWVTSSLVLALESVLQVLVRVRLSPCSLVFLSSKGKLSSTQKCHCVLTHHNPHDWPPKRHPQSGYWRRARGWRCLQDKPSARAAWVRTLGVRHMSAVRAAASVEAIKSSSVPSLLLFCFIPAGGRPPKWLLVRYPLAGL